MPSSLMHYSERFRTEGESFQNELTLPVLVWSASTSGSGSDDGWLSTRSLNFGALPTQGDPVVFELRKSLEHPNPFATGITVGRTVSNDVVLPHASVSRFHAYFQKDPQGRGWSVVDAESKNGTFLVGVRLEPNKPIPLGAEAALRFGDMEVQFLEARAFLALLQRTRPV